MAKVRLYKATLNLIFCSNLYHGNNIVVYSTSFTIEDVIIANYDLRSKIASLGQTAAIESIVTQSSKVIKYEIKNINYKMP